MWSSAAIADSLIAIFTAAACTIVGACCLDGIASCDGTCCCDKVMASLIADDAAGSSGATEDFSINKAAVGCWFVEGWIVIGLRCAVSSSDNDNKSCLDGWEGFPADVKEGVALDNSDEDCLGSWIIAEADAERVSSNVV